MWGLLFIITFYYLYLKKPYDGIKFGDGLFLDLQNGNKNKKNIYLKPRLYIDKFKYEFSENIFWSGKFYAI